VKPAIFVLALLATIPALARSQDSSPSEAVVAAVKRATVFVQVRGTDWLGTGSGFVVKSSKDSVYVATNYHVVSGSSGDRRLRPTEAVQLTKGARINCVFDSGNKGERTATANVVAIDPVADLAVLQIAGLADPPTAIIVSPTKLFETMPVFSFGFPFGKSLGVGQASPAVTVGKGSISSLRLGDNGELSVIQIDGNLNPGNSGGPVVDAKGQLVGIAVAKVRDGQGIGFVVPAAELSRMMAGSLSRPHLTPSANAEGKVTIKVEVGVADPLGAAGPVALHYVVVDAKGKKPAASDSIEKLAGAKHVDLKINGNVATGDVVIEQAAGELFVQATDGRLKFVSTVRSLDLTAMAAQATGKPPEGWKEFIPRDAAFSIWIPEKAKRQSERERTATIRGARLRTTSVTVEMANGLVYLADQLTVPVTTGNKLRPEELEDGFRDWVAADLDGKVTSESEVQLGSLTGREYKIAGNRKSSRVRLFVAPGGRVLILQVTGGGPAVDGDEALTFLNSCRLSPAVVRKDPPAVATLPKTLGPTTKPVPAKVANGPKPRMLGFAIGPEFRELAPQGGVLIGLELGLVDDNGKFLIREERAIYRVGDKEVFGDKRGTATGPTVTLKAKDGYAVGALSAKTGFAVDGLSLTFMKLKDGRLDTTDAYESEWAGGSPKELVPVKLTFGTAPAVGLIGRADDKNLIAIGTVFRGQEGMIGAVPPPGTRHTPIHGGGGDPEFQQITPADSQFVGLHVGLGKFFDNDVVKSIRPVFRKGSTDTLGTLVGTEIKRVVKVVAKPGYAVGALTVKNGLGVDGISITFMKVVDGKLDPSDAYESDWIGGQGGGGPVKLAGDGVAVLGVIGKSNPRELTGIGLLLQK
jgi:S1-C subfamily serine protease